MQFHGLETQTVDSNQRESNKGKFDRENIAHIDGSVLHVKQLEISCFVRKTVVPAVGILKKTV